MRLWKRTASCWKQSEITHRIVVITCRIQQKRNSPKQLCSNVLCDVDLLALDVKLSISDTFVLFSDSVNRLNRMSCYLMHLQFLFILIFTQIFLHICTLCIICRAISVLCMIIPWMYLLVRVFAVHWRPFRRCYCVRGLAEQLIVSLISIRLDLLCCVR